MYLAILRSFKKPCKQPNMALAVNLIAAAVLQLVASNPVSYYKPLTAEEVQRILSWTPDSNEPMWLLSGQYEGDMVLTPDQRNGILDPRRRWPNREIPYELAPEFTQQHRQFIAQSLQGEFRKTCIKVRPRTTADRDYVYVTGNSLGCTSVIGRTGGMQRLSLNIGSCMLRGTIVHEFLHALGFFHQQNVPDRDSYVDIIWQNIRRDQVHNFQKNTHQEVTSFGQPYDYNSIMHYPRNAFSINDQPTIIPKDPKAQIGDKQQLSPSDIIKLNKMYGCA